MLKVGLIGCGGIGTMHAKCWMAMKDRAVLCAIADFATEKANALAAECGARVYQTADEMLQKEELDAVDICLPTALHAEFVLKAMARVKNVIVEKPLCLTEEEAERLLAAEKEHRAFIQVAHIGRFGASQRYLTEAVKSGRYGKLISADFVRLSARPTWVKDYDNEAKTGGMALDFHIHDTDYIRHLMGGDPDTLSANGVVTEDGVITHLWSEYRYGDAVIHTEASWDFPAHFPFTKTYRVRLEGATLIFENKVLTVYPEVGEPFSPPLDDGAVLDVGINIKSFGVFLRELTAFADAITSGGAAVVSLKEAASAIRIAKEEIRQIRKNAYNAHALHLVSHHARRTRREGNRPLRTRARL